MYFKLILLVNKLNVTFLPTNEVRFQTNKISVHLRPQTEAEKKKSKTPDSLYCEAKLKKDAPEFVRHAYDRLLDNRLPEGFQKPSREQPGNIDRYPSVDEDGNLAPKYVPPVQLYSEDFRQFFYKLQNELSDTIQNFVKLVRWRMGKTSHHDPVSQTRGMWWSLNGQSWKKMPVDFGGRIIFELLPQFDEELLSKTKKQLKKKLYEPLGHELFLEAWELQASNPRSSLIIGMAAAEVGMKQCIATLVPDAEWLANNVPSPPLDKLIKNYLPLLPAKLKFKNRILLPPKRIRGLIGKGVEMRNKTAHAGQAAPEHKELGSLLIGIRDLLFLLDYYCGYEWAILNVQQQTVQEMRDENNLYIPMGLNVLNPMDFY